MPKLLCPQIILKNYYVILIADFAPSGSKIGTKAVKFNSPTP